MSKLALISSQVQTAKLFGERCNRNEEFRLSITALTSWAISLTLRLSSEMPSTTLKLRSIILGMDSCAASSGDFLSISKFPVFSSEHVLKTTFSRSLKLDAFVPSLFKLMVEQIKPYDGGNTFL